MDNCTALIIYIAVFKRLHVKQRKTCKLNCTLLIWRLTSIVNFNQIFLVRLK